MHPAQPIPFPFAEATQVVGPILLGEPGRSGVAGWNVGALLVMMAALTLGYALLRFVMKNGA